MFTIKIQVRVDSVQYYLRGGNSLRKTAQKFHVSYRALIKWVKLYRQQGEERLSAERHWNRAKKEMEEKIVLLKERNPCLTLRKAEEILGQDGINISIKGIWGIWKRYGYMGFIKGNMSGDFTVHCSWTQETIRKFERAKEIYNRGNIKESARILNSVPVLPKNEFILQIPDRYLNFRRRVEKMVSLFGKMPGRCYLKKIRNLYKKCKDKNLNYSALRLGISELMALSWTAEPMKQLKRTEELEKILGRTKNRSCLGNGHGRHVSYSILAARFSLLISEGIAYARLLKIKEASDIAKCCRELLRRNRYASANFMFDLGVLYSNLDNFKEAEYWYLRSLEKGNKEVKRIAKNFLSNILFSKGKYGEAIRVLKKQKLELWGYPSRMLLYQSQQSLINGMPHKAISLSMKTLTILKKEEIRLRMFMVYLILAISYCSLGEKPKAESMLKRFVPFLTKNKRRKEMAILEVILSRTPNHQSRLLQKQDILPTARLALLLKTGEYRKAFKYAEREGILAYLHRYVFFFPETITELLNKGKPTRLPKAMLKLPVFNKEIPVYYIKFLGNLIVCPVREHTALQSKQEMKQVFNGVNRKRKYLKIRLSPKDTAFLIHLALRVEEPDKKISLADLCTNFWTNSLNPSRNLSHLLVRIKKALRIPSHLLDISYKRGNPVLINRGIHFITDYMECEQKLIRARALERAGEWGFAKKEYMQAFKLFRGEPFRKMYDLWSEHIRRVILNKLETKALHFAKSCFEHDNEIRQKKRRTPSAKCRGGNMADAKKVLEKVVKIIPNSEESVEILQTL